jgi:hypothetical protein
MQRLALLVLVLSAALPAAAPLALAQDPQPPGEQPGEPQGEPQPGAPDEPEEPDEPGAVQPGVEQPGLGTPGAESQLPRTGLEVVGIAALGILLLLAGARLRVVARVREVRERVRRRLSPELRLRESLERLRVEASRPPEVEPRVVRVEPKTPTARRLAGRPEERLEPSNARPTAP